MTSDMVQVGTPAGRVSPQLAVALFIVLFASVVGVGLFGDDLADLGRRRAPSPPASPLAVASTAASARASAGLDATPHPTASPTPTPVCDPPVIEPLADRIARHPGSLVATTLESLVPPTEFDGQILLDGRGVMWSHGPGRLARLDSEGHAVQGWTVADDARFGASIVAPARDGGVWLVSDGTAEIAWFDGRRFRDIVPLPGATSSVAEAADGTLWAVINRDDATTSSHEPAHWDGVRWTPVCTNEPSDWYDSLAVDGLGNVWMLSYGETGPAAAWRFDGAEWTTYGPTLDGPLPRGAPQALTVAPDGAVWLSYPTALARVDAWSLTVHEAPEDVDLSGATSFVIDRAGVAWLAAGTRTQAPYTAVGVHVVRFDGQSWRQFDASDGLPAPLEDWWVVVTSLAVEPRGMVAFTPRGLYALDGDRWERIDRHVAPLDAVNAVVVSADEAWVTTTSDGLWHYRAGHWVRDNPPRFRGWPRSLVRGPGDTIAVATDRQVAIRRAGTWSVLVEAEGSLGPVGLAFAPDGVLWASIADSSDLATFEWTGQDWTRRQIEVDPPAVMAGAIAFDRDQSPWLIGFGYVPRSIRLVDGRWQAIVVGEGLEPTGQIAIGRDGTVWLPVWRTPNEVALGAFDGRTWRVVEMGDGVGYVTSIAAAPDGSLLVGSSEGLSRFDGEHWEPMIRTGYLDAVAVGPDGSILACGSPGIVRVHVVQR